MNEDKVIGMLKLLCAAEAIEDRSRWALLMVPPEEVEVARVAISRRGYEITRSEHTTYEGAECEMLTLWMPETN